MLRTVMSARNTVKSRLNAKNPPKIAAAQRKRLSDPATMPDSKIDYLNTA
jgi:hypothetical protein